MVARSVIGCLWLFFLPAVSWGGQIFAAPVDAHRFPRRTVSPTPSASPCFGHLCSFLGCTSELVGDVGSGVVKRSTPWEVHPLAF
uniref:Secreted protein n=1 Tax=Arundo donax TaxID=35708 RepID=A0A0A9FA25_ARUDO